MTRTRREIFARCGGYALRRERRRAMSAFTLLELLAVMAIMAVLITVTLPSVSGLLGAGAVNGAVSDFSSTLEHDRTYAMAQHTHVLVAIGEINSGTPQAMLVVLSLISADGSDSADLSVASNWPTIAPPLVLKSFLVNDKLNGTNPDTSGDTIPSQSNIGTITRNIEGFGPVVFTSVIEYNPVGEASIDLDNPAHFIKIGIDQPAPRAGQNPFVLRIAGINGTVSVLRKDQL